MAPLLAAEAAPPPYPLALCGESLGVVGIKGGGACERHSKPSEYPFDTGRSVDFRLAEEDAPGLEVVFVVLLRFTAIAARTVLLFPEEPALSCPDTLVGPPEAASEEGDVDGVRKMLSRFFFAYSFALKGMTIPPPPPNSPPPPLLLPNAIFRLKRGAVALGGGGALSQFWFGSRDVFGILGFGIGSRDLRLGEEGEVLECFLLRGEERTGL